MRLSIFLVAALVVLTACPAAVAHAALPLSVVQDDAQLLRSGPAAREQTLDDAASLGVDVVRILAVWKDFSRRPTALDELDAAVTGARARGLRVLLNPSGPAPRSASTCRPRRDVCAPSPRAFGAWVAQLGRRYPEVRDWSVWNEPNNPNWLQPQHSTDGRPSSPALYRRLLGAAAAGLRRSGHAGNLILAGETAPMPAARSRPPARRPVAAGSFLTRLLAGNRPIGATGIAQHPYATDGRSPFGEREAAQFTMAGVPRLKDLVRDAARRGVLPSRAPVWLTELGFQTDPPDALFGISLTRQANWLARVEVRAEREQVAALGHYLLVDEGPLQRFQSGLRFADGRPKPAFDAYRLPLTAERRGSRVVLRGRVRPVKRAGVPIGIEQRPWPRAIPEPLLHLTTGGGGAVRATVLRRPGQVRLTWTAPDGHVDTGAWTPLP